MSDPVMHAGICVHISYVRNAVVLVNAFTDHARWLSSYLLTQGFYNELRYTSQGPQDNCLAFLITSPALRFNFSTKYI